MSTYDKGNIFAKILAGDIPNDTVHEDDHVLAFRDIEPQAPTHVLVIPKGAYTTWHDFARDGTAAEHSAFVQAVAAVTKAEGVEKSGYRLIVNNGKNGHQDVPHVHMHVVGGRPVGPMLKRQS
ncbi:MAG: HIT domain-containing protein [Alphaproteobacteria bacterium]